MLKRTHLIFAKHVIEVMDVKYAYPNPKAEFSTCIERDSSPGILEVNVPFHEFKQEFEKAFGVEDK